VLTGFLIFLLLVVGLLAMPVTMTYRLSWRESFSGDVKLRWAFGLIRIGASSDRAKSRAGDAEVAKPKVGRSGRSSGRKPNFLAAIRRRSFRRRLLKFLSDVWSAVRKENVRLLVRLGLEDPADTGQLWAVIGPLTGMLAGMTGVTIAMEPEFLESTFELDSSGTIRLVPLQLAYVAFALLLSPAFWRGVILMRTPG